MSGLDLSRESPGDIVVTLRSLPRRFREALEGGEGEEGDEVSPVALGHVAQTAHDLVAASRALGDATGVHGGVPADAGTELERLTAAATALADQVARVPSGAWDDAGLEAARHAVRVGIDGLRATERAIADAP